LWRHSTSSVARAPGSTGAASCTRASVDCRPTTVGSLAPAALAAAAAAVSEFAPCPRGAFAPAASSRAARPSTARRVITIPSVASAGTHGAALGVSGRKMLGSSRSTICRSVSGLALWITTRSRPVSAEVAVSRRAAMV
jgi:hypothetical protein